eukprot:863532_1
MAMIEEKNNTPISNMKTQRILAAIHSLGNPTQKNIDQWFKYNLCSTDNLDTYTVQTILLNLVNTGVINKVNKRYSLNNNMPYQPEPNNSHIHSNLFSINYSELQISKIRSQKKIIEALKNADRHASSITR